MGGHIVHFFVEHLLSLLSAGSHDPVDGAD